MMNTLRIHFCLLLLYFAATASAQSARFANRHLQQLAATLQAEYGTDCTRPGIFGFGENRLRVTKAPSGCIAHIGLVLFPENIVRDNPSPVYAFVERYLLELYLSQENPTPEQRLKEDRVTLHFAGHEDRPLRENIACRLPHFQKNTSLLVLTDNHRYSVSIYEDSQLQLFIRFPIRYELLWGMNKVEAENGFYESLLRHRMPAHTPGNLLSTDEQTSLEAGERGLFISPGDSYMIPSVNSDRFYRLTAEGKYVPVYDKAHAEESLRNLFLLPELGTDVTATVRQRMYKRRTREFEVPLQKLLDFCRTEGCQTFVGIEACTEKSITGTAVLLNPSYGYCHQLYFQARTEMLEAPNRFRIDIELYAFVPTHNIGNLFGDDNN